MSRRASNWSRRAAVLGVAALLVIACKEDPVRPPLAEGTSADPRLSGGGGGSSTAGDAAVPDGAAGDAGDGGAACNTLAIAGLTNDLIAVADNPPPGLGGTIVPGIYDLTDAQVFTGLSGLPGPTSTTYRGALEIDEQNYSRALLIEGPSGSVEERRVVGGWFGNSGAPGNATISLTCPRSAQEGVTYTVQGNNLIITETATKISLTFVRRP